MIRVLKSENLPVRTLGFPAAEMDPREPQREDGQACCVPGMWLFAQLQGLVHQDWCSFSTWVLSIRYQGIISL